MARFTVMALASVCLLLVIVAQASNIEAGEWFVCAKACVAAARLQTAPSAMRAADLAIIGHACQTWRSSSSALAHACLQPKCSCRPCTQRPGQPNGGRAYLHCDFGSAVNVCVYYTDAELVHAADRTHAMGHT